MLSSSKSGPRIRGFRGSTLISYSLEKKKKLGKKEKSLGLWDINWDRIKIHEKSWSLKYDSFHINNTAGRFLLLKSVDINEFFSTEGHQVPASLISRGLWKIKCLV